MLSLMDEDEIPSFPSDELPEDTGVGGTGVDAPVPAGGRPAPFEAGRVVAAFTFVAEGEASAINQGHPQNKHDPFSLTS